MKFAVKSLKSIKNKNKKIQSASTQGLNECLDTAQLLVCHEILFRESHNCRFQFPALTFLSRFIKYSIIFLKNEILLLESHILESFFQKTIIQCGFCTPLNANVTI